VDNQLEGVQHRPEQTEGAGCEEADADGSVGDSVQGFRDCSSYIGN